MTLHLVLDDEKYAGLSELLAALPERLHQRLEREDVECLANALRLQESERAGRLYEMLKRV